ncbi:hypothetical protein [Streptomyces zhihengii]|uniref:Uncharacterized protein n=1 Tax=Streptomyces zhihengii TaxID=1818004 RepID=A0ABS2V780_9ACTN|nr:hypothetical protein [Streptomyces zhihengii]MBM9624630.1 hypothetical protein [Streptomyces zhihengii]
MVQQKREVARVAVGSADTESLTTVVLGYDLVDLLVSDDFLVGCRKLRREAQAFPRRP